MQAKLERISQIADKEEKKQQYLSLVNELLATEDKKNLETFIEHIASQNGIISRPIVQEFAEKYREKRKAGNGAGLLQTCEKAITTLSNSQTMAFQEYTNSLRFDVAKVYQKDQSVPTDENDDKSVYQKAAIHLSKINLEREDSSISPQDKVKIWIDCARLYLVDALYREAEIFVNKCAPFMNQKPMKEIYKIRFWSCMASCQDYNGKNHQAATGYYRLSEKIHDEDTALDKLSKGIKCVVLIPAGPSRDRLLAKYYRDERVARLEGFSFLEALFVGRFLTKNEIEAFQGGLEEHQQKKTKEGWTQLEKASIEHNLIAAAKVYNNILLTDLGHVLGVTEEKAEEIAANMISEGRLQGEIDQSKSLLHFHVTPALTEWDTHIEITCSAVNSVVDKISALHPEWVSNHFA